MLSLNIEGCFNVFESARRQGVRRIVFASSNHAVGFHRRERFIDNTVSPRPELRAMGFQKCLVRRLVDFMLINMV